MANERVQVDPSEIKVGDLIEVERPYGDEGAMVIRRDVVIQVSPDQVETREFSFAINVALERTYYRLPKPAPVEPKGLGAVVEDNVGDLWIHTDRDDFSWMTPQGDTSRWEQLLEIYGPITVKSDGYTAE